MRVTTYGYNSAQIFEPGCTPAPIAVEYAVLGPCWQPHPPKHAVAFEQFRRLGCTQCPHRVGDVPIEGQQEGPVSEQELKCAVGDSLEHEGERSVADAYDVARWMCEVLSKRGYLEQAYAVLEIELQFGSAFVYLNRNENPAIARSVLKAFRDLCGDDVVWEKSGRNWRLREPGDPSGRQVE